MRPKLDDSGFWFGGGNIAVAPDGQTYLVGRYRNSGDSRTGVELGERGAELVVVELKPGRDPMVLHRFTKADLSRPDREVLSIEGSCLSITDRGVELLVSSEKDARYPEDVREYQKPGTGVWSIDVIRAAGIEGLDPQGIEPLLESSDPAHLHVKDPFLYVRVAGDAVLLYCTHPFGWSSSNTGYCTRPAGDKSFGAMCNGFFPRGATWDVAMSRITGALAVPRRGRFAELPPTTLYFYDGGECVRSHGEHEQAVARPRGYSCEELGGLAWGWDGEFPSLHRLSVLEPMFVSPHGTGCSRYVHATVCAAGIRATWQRSQPDGSQPLVHHLLEWDEVDEVLG